MEELFDAVFDLDHRMALPSLAVMALRPDMVNSETDYWKGKHKGVTESDIVAAVNEAVAALGLPAYAKVTNSQVRDTRRRMFSVNPKFIGQGYGVKDEQTGKFKESEKMSPIQAAYVTRTLIDRKLTYEELQVTPEEWEANMTAHKPTGPTAEHSLVGTSQKSWELQNQMSTSLYKMSDLDGLKLLKSTLSHLGVN